MSVVFSCENCGRECWRDESDVHRTRCFECCRYHEQTEALKAVEAERDALKAQLAAGLVPPPLEAKEFCICAAVKTVEGRIIRGHRHDGAMITAGNMKLTLAPYGEDQQGFVTSKGRYVNRKEAADLQRAAGIKTVDPNRIDFPDELFSEDLY